MENGDLLMKLLQNAVGIAKGDICVQYVRVCYAVPLIVGRLQASGVLLIGPLILQHYKRYILKSLCSVEVIDKSVSSFRCQESNNA